MQMRISSEPRALISEKVFDLFFVEIHGHAFSYKSFDYIIYGNGRQMMRRGQFRAPSVQLRTSDLREGTYEFTLLLDGEEYQTASFQKCNKPG